MPVSPNGGGLTHVVQQIRDVTPEVEATQTLRAERDAFRMTFDMAPDAVLLIRPDGTVHDCNTAACRMYGHAKDELVGNDAHDLVPEGLRKAWSRVIQPDQTTGGVTIESRGQRASGEQFPTEVSSRPVTIGGRLFVLLNVHDLSKRKAVLDQLRESQAELAALMDNMPDSIYFKDTSLRFTRINRALAEQLGTDSPQEAVGKNDFHYFTQSHAARAAEQEKRILETGDPLIDFVEYDEFLDGRRRWVSTTQVPIYGDDRRPVGLVGISRDITQRRHTEQAYRALVDHSSLGLVIFQANHVAFVNERLAKLSGYTRDELLAMSTEQVWNLVHPDDRDRLWSVLDAIQEGRDDGGSYEFRAHHRDGSIRYLEAHGNRIDYRGRPAVQATVLDVTQRMQAENLVRENESRNALAHKIAGLVSWTWDVGTDRVTWTDEMETLFGVQPGELGGTYEALMRFMHPEDRDETAEAIQHALATRSMISSEHRIIRADGEVRWVRLLGDFVSTDDEQPSRMVGVIQDITARKEMEVALRQSEERLRMLVNSAEDIVVLHDTEGRYLYFNGPKRYNVTAEELIGKTPVDVLGEEAGLPIVDQIKRVAATRESMVVENRLAWQGETLWFADLIYPVCDDNGNIVHVGKICRNITQRKRIEHALRASEERYRSLVENVDLTIILMDRDHNIVMTNPAHERMFGKPCADVVARKCYEVYKGRSEPCPDCGGSKAMQTKQPVDREAQSTRHDGEPFTIRVRSYPVLDESGQAQGFVEIIEDVTAEKQAEDERLRMEARLRESQKLESLGLLAGGVAHDFNNLLTGILGNASLLLMDMPAESPYREPVSLIETSALRAAELTNQMLAYSGRGSFMVERLDLSDLVQRMSPLLHSAKPKRVKLVLRLDDDLPPIRADAGQLHQVITNLVVNASEAIDDGHGTITVKTGRVDISDDYLSATYLPQGLQEGEYAFLEVSDTGCGMDEDTRARIFDPFFSTKFTGRGLGMAAVLGIVRGHQGAIKVYSEPGSGTTLKILLPAYNEEGDHMAPRDIESPAPIDFQGRGSALIIDDEQPVRKAARNMLEQVGFQVLTAENGPDGIALFQEHQDDITFVILDLTMPVMSGEETFRRLRALNRDIPVFITSGYQEDDVISRFAGRGAAGFIQKPFRLQELIAKLQLAQRDAGDPPPHHA